MKKVMFLAVAACLIFAACGNNGGNSQSGSSTGSETNGTPVLTISKTGSGSASVTAGGNMVNSGASIAEDTQVTITITPATGMTPSAPSTATT